MRAIVRRELKNFLKNPLFWLGFIIVTVGVYQDTSPWLGLHYFRSDQEIAALPEVEVISDGDILGGYIPVEPEERRKLWEQEIKEALEQEFQMTEKEAESVIETMSSMEIEDACSYLEEHYGYYGAIYLYEDLIYRRGTAEEANGYIRKMLEKHPYSWYFARKFTDFSGLYLGFFAVVLLAFLFWQDTRRSNYELLHTKAVRPWQYVAGKVLGGFLILCLMLLVLNLVFTVLCGITAVREGFRWNPLDLLITSCGCILPNMLMTASVYAAASLLFRNPLPAVPLLFVYLLYSNMGSWNEEGQFGFYGRPLAIMVRFPGSFFETELPDIVRWNQLFLLAASLLLMYAAAKLWKKRRMYGT